MPEIQPVKLDFPGNSPTSSRRIPIADPHLSVAAVARALRISPPTLRRYIRDYADHVDVVREGRKHMIAVSSVPTLAQIRDLQARKCRRDDIRRLLAGLPGPATLAGLSDSLEGAVGAAVEEAVEASLGDVRADLASLKKASHDSDVVVRQSLANILFLIDKFGKEQQYHASEERIANIERDLLLMQSQIAPKELPKPQREKRTSRFIAAVTSLYRRLSTTFL